MMKIKARVRESIMLVVSNTYYDHYTVSTEANLSCKA